MVQVNICVGSSCHIKGSSGVVEALKQAVFQNRLTDKVELCASFCMGECIDGVCVTINGKKMKKVTESNVEEIFKTEILPLV